MVTDGAMRLIKVAIVLRGKHPDSADGVMGLIKVAIVLRGNSWIAPRWLGDIDLVTSYCPFTVA